jgi:hypothetical protein
MKRELHIDILSGTFHLLLDDSGYAVCSCDLHCELGNHEPASWNRYEGAIDSLESLVLAAAQNGIDVESRDFRSVLQTTVDAIEKYFVNV